MDVYRLSQYLPEYMERTLPKSSKGFYVCPFCSSGEKRNKTGALKNYRSERKEMYKCYACGECGDLFDLIGKVERLTFKESLARAEDMFGDWDPKPIQKKERKQNMPNMYKDYIESSIKNVNGAREYLEKRGFTMANAKQFLLGYDRDNDGLVIPYDSTYAYYLRRSLKEKRFYKPPSDQAGPEPIYNIGALKGKSPVFVCESPIDAISIMVASKVQAIAIGGTGVKKLLDQIDKRGINVPIIVSLDDDEDKERNAGLETAKTLMGELAGREIPFVLAKYSKDLYPKTRRKDANDMLCSRREVFEADIKENIRRAKLVKVLMEEGAI